MVYEQKIKNHSVRITFFVSSLLYFPLYFAINYGVELKMLLPHYKTRNEVKLEHSITQYFVLLYFIGINKFFFC